MQQCNFPRQSTKKPNIADSLNDFIAGIYTTYNMPMVTCILNSCRLDRRCSRNYSWQPIGCLKSKCIVTWLLLYYLQFRSQARLQAPASTKTTLIQREPARLSSWQTLKNMVQSEGVSWQNTR